MGSGGRIALQTALGALAGGAQGYAQQQEYNRQQQERENERKRQALLDALTFAEREITPETPDMASQPFDEKMTRRVTVGDTTYRMPTAEGRARSQAAVTRQLADEEKQRVRKEAFDTLGTLDPAFRTATYNPNVQYETLLENKQATERAGAAARATANAYTQRDETQRLAQARQQKALAMAWYQQQMQGMNQAQANQFGSTVAAVARELAGAGMPSTPADVALALYDATRGGSFIDAQEALAAQREAQAAAGGGRAVVPPPGGRAVVPTGGSSPAEAGKETITQEDYDDLRSNGFDDAWIRRVYNVPSSIRIRG